MNPRRAFTLLVHQLAFQFSHARIQFFILGRKLVLAILRRF